VIALSATRAGQPAGEGVRRCLLGVLVVLLPLCGCARRQPQPTPPPARVTVIAWVHAQSPGRQATVELLRTLQECYPDRLDLHVVDIDDPEGFRRWREADLDSAAIFINGSTTVAWEEEGRRRIVNFRYPAGFTWTYADLRAAVTAAVAGRLTAAAPEEAEAVRPLQTSVRAQSIRVGDSEVETGQLLIDGAVVIEITHNAGPLAPGQRVERAADALTEVLSRPFTPNRLVARKTEEGAVVCADDRELLAVTPADAAEQGLEAAQLAARWRRAIYDALALAALKNAEADFERRRT